MANPRRAKMTVDAKSKTSGKKTTRRRKFEAGPRSQTPEALNNIMLQELSLYLSQEEQIDPVVVHGLALLLPMIHVKPGAVPEDKMKLIRAAAAGYLAGVDSGRAFASRTSAQDGKMAFTLNE